MHIQLQLINNQIITLPTSWAKLNSDSPSGRIDLTVGEGITQMIPKSAIIGIVQFTDDAWAKVQEERKKMQKEDNRQRAQGQRDAWYKQPLWKRIGRHCPITLPADIAEEGKA
jgi:hypothetical protein